MTETVAPPPHFLRFLRDNSFPEWAEWPYRICSPGRVNLIGEHLDYTGGLVLPAAIDYSLYFAARPLDEPVWKLHAIDLGESATAQLPVTGRSADLWVDYLLGIGVQFQDQGHFLPGLEIVFGGDLPRGSGLSSSAALEGGMAYLLNELLNNKLSRPELAALCQRSSNTFLGIPTGIMDQFASLNGHRDGPIILNCETLTSEPVKNEIHGYTWLLTNSKVTHDLSDGAYAERVEECQRALETVQKTFLRVQHLSATQPEQLQMVIGEMDEVAARRATYVVEENVRVRCAVNALEAGSGRVLGELLNQSHAGLSKQYEVTCEETDFLQERTAAYPGVAGSRQMGGGFGGCLLNFVREDAVEGLKQDLTEAYQEAYGITPEFYPVHFADGTRFV